MRNNIPKPSIDYKLLSTTFFVIIVVLIGVVFYLILDVNSPNQVDITSTANSNLTFTTIPSSLPSTTPTPAPESVKYPLDKKYIFPLQGSADQMFGEFTYSLVEYELTNQVVLNKLYKALVTNDKEILVLHIEITNDTEQAFQIMAGDYVRLTKNNDSKLIAPDIDEDPVEVRPHSTISTSLGFSISKKDINLIIQVGELNENKDYIKINKPKRQGYSSPNQSSHNAHTAL